MKNLIIILLTITLTSCLTEKRFNKIVDKGLSKGWVDTTTTTIDTSIVGIDTTGLSEKIKKGLSPIIEYVNTLKDTCYNKQGKVIGTKVDTKVLKKKIKQSESKLDTIVTKEIFTCLKRPIFFSKNGVLVEVFQDSLGKFDIKVEVKKTTITKPVKIPWYKKYLLDVWFLWWAILLLLFIILIRK